MRNVPCLSAGGCDFMQELQHNGSPRLWDLNRIYNDAIWNHLLQHFGLGIDSIIAKEEHLVDGTQQNPLERTHTSVFEYQLEGL
jgi:hypothetical protein